jgi:uncharacterized protein YegP (UPF0339 family)
MSEVEIEVYEDMKGEWRWRMVAGNGEVIATSGEGYTRKGDATRAANTAKKRMAETDK